MKGSWGTRLADRFHIPRPPKRGAKARRPPGPSRTRPSAVSALRRAEEWAAEIDAGATRASIARREGLTRARITQLMKLLALPSRVRAELAGDTGAQWSIRRALRELEEVGDE